MADVETTPVQTDPVDALYKRLKTDGYSVPQKPEDFHALMGTQDYAFKMHRFLAKHNYSVPEEFQDFYGVMNPEKKKEEVAPPPGMAGLYQPPSPLPGPVGPLSNGVAGTGEPSQQAPVIPEPKFDDEADRQKALRDLDAQIAEQKFALGNPAAIAELGKQLPANGNEPPKTPEQQSLDYYKGKQDERVLRENLGINEPEKESNPFVTMSKSGWNALWYQLPSAMVATLAAASRPSKANPENYDPEHLLQAENKNKDVKIGLLKWAEDRQIQGEGVTKNLVSSLDKIRDPIDALNWVSYALGQAGGQIIPSVATMGVTSIGQEVGSIYLEGVQKIGHERGLTIEGVIDQELDKPAFALAYGTAAGLLDYFSANRAMNLGKQSLFQSLRTRSLEMVKSGGVEAGTEYAQTWMEQIGASQVAGGDLAKAWKEANTTPAFMERLESAAQGFVGGPGTHVMGHLAAKLLANEKPQRPAGPPAGAEPVSENKAQGPQAQEATQPPPATEKPTEVKAEEPVTTAVQQEKETKTQQDAIPVGISEKAPLGEAPGGSQEVGGGVPQPGETTLPQEKQKEPVGEPAPEKVKIPKPEIKLNLISARDLVKSNDPVGNKAKQQEIIDEYKELKKLIDCLHG